MDENGNLRPLPPKTKICEACGTIFILGPKEHRTRWCEICRPAGYAKACNDNYYGIYRRGKYPRHVDPKQEIERQYFIKCLDVIIDHIDKNKKKREKHDPIIKMRLAGKTLKEIGIEFHVSKQYVQQICAKYL
jgi:hypothetical protein